MDTIKIDLGLKEGKIKPIHSANNGPVAYGALLNVSGYYKEIGFPYLRLHDTNWPNPTEVDVHTIFTNFDADPNSPDSYDFRRTDDYIKSITDTGAKIVYRLGTSIEHTLRKYHIDPPKDFAKWAEICKGIIRHYNSGWANGFHYGIEYWEIWNEPEGMPITGSNERLRLMWSGTNEQFLNLYRITSTAIKSEFPDVKVGGFAATMTDFPFIDSFLSMCKSENLPCDFFSWHAYGIDPEVVAETICSVRAILDKHGLFATESHLNEWNYTKAPEGVTEFSEMFGLGNEYNTQAIFDALSSEEGASYDAALLIKMQQLPIDMANFYDASPTSTFSLFNRYGVPQKNYYAFKAFGDLCRHPIKIHSEISSNTIGLYCLAGINEENDETAILISNFSKEEREFVLQIDNTRELICDKYILDHDRNLEIADSWVLTEKEFEKTQHIGKHTVLLLKIKRA